MTWAWLLAQELALRKHSENLSCHLKFTQRQYQTSVAVDSCPVAESATYRGSRAELFNFSVPPVLICKYCLYFVRLGHRSQSSSSLRGAQVAPGSIWLCDFDKLLNLSVPLNLPL